MGNCIKPSSSAAMASTTATAVTVTGQADIKPVKPRSSCDERTIETSSYATISPPASPIKPDPLGVKQDETDIVASHNVSQPKIEENQSSMEQQREEGQNRLRELVITGANCGQIDWKSIISLAEDLHRREQQLLRSYNEPRWGNKSTKMSSGGRSRQNISRRQAFFEKRRRRREVSRRRKLESVGSFSVNLLDERRRQEESPPIQGCETDISSPFPEIENAIDDSEELDVFEDDDLPLHYGTSCSMSPCRTLYQRPGTPSPFTKPSPAGVVVEMEGSFMAATSLFGPAKEKDECSSNSSSDSSTSSGAFQGENWDLMTIDENATVSDW